MNEIDEFEKACIKQWGTSQRTFPRDLWMSGIQDFVNFADISSELKIHIAKKMIYESCSPMGTLSHNGDVTWFIYNFAHEMKFRKGIFDDRMSTSIKSALILISAGSLPISGPAKNDIEIILKGGGALATMYLLAQLEFLFRVKSKYLKWDGSIKVPIPEELISSLKINKNQKRINQIGQTIQLFLYKNEEPIAQIFHELDDKLLHMFSGMSISERLNTIRNEAMHGAMHDPSTEGSFYALLLSIFYYCEKDDPNYKYGIIPE